MPFLNLIGVDMVISVSNHYWNPWICNRYHTRQLSTNLLLLAYSRYLIFWFMRFIFFPCWITPAIIINFFFFLYCIIHLINILDPKILLDHYIHTNGHVKLRNNKLFVLKFWFIGFKVLDCCLTLKAGLLFWQSYLDHVNKNLKWGIQGGYLFETHCQVV